MEAKTFRVYASQARSTAGSWWQARAGSSLVERVVWVGLLILVAVPLVALLSVLLVVGLAVLLAGALIGYVRALLGGLRFGRQGIAPRDSSGREGVRVVRRS